MPPKKDTAGDASELVVGFTNKEAKLLAAAYLSSTAPDKFDYDLMATLTNNTAGSLKKMWPPVKKKAIESHPSFAKFLGHSGAADAPSSQVTPKKRKPSEDAAEEADESEQNPSESEKKASKAKKSTAEKKPGRGRGRPKKQVKNEETDNGNASEKAADDAAESDQDKSEPEKKPSKSKKPATDKPARDRGRPKKQIKTEEAADDDDDNNDKVNSENSADGGDGLDDNVGTEV